MQPNATNFQQSLSPNFRQLKYAFNRTNILILQTSEEHVRIPHILMHVMGFNETNKLPEIKYQNGNNKVTHFHSIMDTPKCLIKS